jgi:hypothetical protein
MNKKRTKATDMEEIAEKAHQGEDVSEHFTGRHLAKQRVNIDLPLRLLRMIDEECRLVGVTRQDWIKMACDERLRQVQTGRNAVKVS